jgi:hypothetical protein
MKLKFILSVFLLTIIGKVFSQKPFTEREDNLKISNKDSILLVNTWNSFLTNIREKNHQEIKEMSLEEVYCTSAGHVLPGLSKDRLMPINLFIDSVMSKFYSGRFINTLTDSTLHLFKAGYPDRKPLNFTTAKGKELVLFDVYFIDLVPKGNAKDQNYYVFRFVKKEGKFKFFELRLESPH